MDSQTDAPLVRCLVLALIVAFPAALLAGDSPGLAGVQKISTIIDIPKALSRARAEHELSLSLRRAGFTVTKEPSAVAVHLSIMGIPAESPNVLSIRIQVLTPAIVKHNAKTTPVAVWTFSRLSVFDGLADDALAAEIPKVVEYLENAWRAENP